MKIAISGKGVGKSTIAANLLHCLMRNNVPTFAVDADPDANLGLVLGWVRKNLPLPPLCDLQEVIIEKMPAGAL